MRCRNKSRLKTSTRSPSCSLWCFPTPTCSQACTRAHVHMPHAPCPNVHVHWRRRTHMPRVPAHVYAWHTHGTRAAYARPMHGMYVRASFRLTKVPFCERSCSQASHTGWRSRGVRCGVVGGRGHTIQWYKRMCRLEMYGMGLRVRAWLIGA